MKESDRVRESAGALALARVRTQGDCEALCNACRLLGWGLAHAINGTRCVYVYGTRCVYMCV